MTVSLGFGKHQHRLEKLDPKLGSQLCGVDGGRRGVGGGGGFSHTIAGDCISSQSSKVDPIVKQSLNELTACNTTPCIIGSI